MMKNKNSIEAKSLRYLDLFAGAGGLSEGFMRAGFSPVSHVEVDEAACYTLKTRLAYKWLEENERPEIYQSYIEGEISRHELYNTVSNKLLESVINCEISESSIENIFERVDELLRGYDLDVIIGGPPCQAYSLVGRARDKKKMLGDKRNYLYILYAEFLKRYKPKYFVFENVLGLLSAKDKNEELHFNKMRKLFRECGYTTEFRILNAADFGVLQNRKRVILIGKYGEHENFYPKIKAEKCKHTVQEIFCDLPTLKSGEGICRPIKTLSYQGVYLFEAGIKKMNQQKVTFHSARPNTDHDLEIYRIAVEMWNSKNKRLCYTDLPKALQTQKNTTSFLDRFKVVAGDLPYSQTVVAHISKDGHYFIHPDIVQNRSLTPREVARLQTFPDDYYFESVSGKPSRTAAYKQIGNAVPVLLAEKIAKALLEVW